MKPTAPRYICLLGLAAGGWMCSGTDGSLVATAHAVVGRPATPVSYAGVARRTTVRAVTPGVGAPGVGVTPRVGVGAPVVAPAPVNLGGPVNRVGVH